ncbi:hypothetical protein KHA90_11245 [Flavobacterium psychroterrae]|jgi:hypothetical protein|uniref:Uncharacterized protein n=1 Tax=Flavobacterium psychroterrae TaxID=2133767 RepID=A0ABS5PBC4_9FLAO|nr:hypothetical protein [Flavobacterium psychroterrae]MBS7231599.1 hypothetical protein [Flavobacterium psychroterrae]
MLNTIKNSLFSKCLQVLLIGYFLISSINVSNSFVRIIYDNADIHSVTGLTCNFLKKVFKCNSVPEEIDDYETKDSKTTKLAKGIPLLDYLIPMDTSLAGLYFEIENKQRNYIENPIFSFGFHGKIHLRPPQFII